jgi:hypothetical protein
LGENFSFSSLRIALTISGALSAVRSIARRNSSSSADENLASNTFITVSAESGVLVVIANPVIKEAHTLFKYFKIQNS